MELSWSYRFIKRLIDLIGASVGLVLAVPAIGLIALAIKLTSRGPVFFRQERTGWRGRSFLMYKFRTMTVDTVVEVGRETLSTDPRITLVGRLLRRTGLDELPQLLNVLMGQMTLVGPRPLLQWENDQCDARQAKRLSVKPGLTGLSQVNGRNRIAWDERVEWDVRYVERASAALDFRILLMTLPVMLLGENAYRDQKERVEAVVVRPVEAAVE